MNNNYLPTLYQQFIHKSRYARWLWDENRRENWDETVARYFNFFEEHLQETNNFKLEATVRKQLEESVLALKTMPSMRCLMTAGEALKRENVAGYNCSYVAVDNPRSFDEILYILMNGTGVGFSVESRFTEQLPVVAEDFHPSDSVIVVADSKLGWAKALKELIHLLYSGQVPKWDVSKVRAAGMPLKTFGGRASGPGPLVDLFNFCVSKFRGAAGRRLTTLECHDIVCKIADVVVVGGVVVMLLWLWLLHAIQQVHRPSNRPSTGSHNARVCALCAVHCAQCAVYKQYTHSPFFHHRVREAPSRAP
jgi:ribonucleoside-diphosphate reductase alpha chain